MSSLKRMFDQFVRVRESKRISRALLEEHEAEAVRLFDTNLDALRKTFASTPTTLQSASLPNYPGGRVDGAYWCQCVWRDAGY